MTEKLLKLTLNPNKQQQLHHSFYKHTCIYYPEISICFWKHLYWWNIDKRSTACFRNLKKAYKNVNKYLTSDYSPMLMFHLIWTWRKLLSFPAKCKPGRSGLLCSGDGNVYKSRAYCWYVCCWPWKTRSRSTSHMFGGVQRGFLKNHQKWYWDTRTCQYRLARN